jgi:hypothetical protein
MNIAIIGTGKMGGTLGKLWAAGGYQIAFGVRNTADPKHAKLLEAAGPNARLATVAGAANDAEVVVLTTPWEGTQNALASAGNLAGKIIIDATNPLLLGAAGLQKGLLLGHTTSGAEQVAAWSPGARVVKAFNSTGASNHANPKYGNQNVSMFICGDDADAKAVVKKLSDELGFETIDAGPLTAARLLEPLAMLWIHLAFEAGFGINFAFKVVKR